MKTQSITSTVGVLSCPYIQALVVYRYDTKDVKVKVFSVCVGPFTTREVSVSIFKEDLSSINFDFKGTRVRSNHCIPSPSQSKPQSKTKTNVREG